MESQVMKRLLTEEGVIGGIVDDFDPLFQLDVIYGHKRISLGDHVSPAQVHHKPSHFEYSPAHPEVLESFRDPTLLTVVMTDPDAPGGEYLHWLCRHFVVTPHEEREMQSQELVSYEAPRERYNMRTRKIVLTAFKLNGGLPNANIGMFVPNIIMPESRNNFSTRDFASTNALGPPLAASFFNIIDPVGNGYH